MSEKSPKNIKNTSKTNIYKFRANSKKAQQVNPSPFKSAQVPWTYFFFHFRIFANSSVTPWCYSYLYCQKYAFQINEKLRKQLETFFARKNFGISDLDLVNAFEVGCGKLWKIERSCKKIPIIRSAENV